MNNLTATQPNTTQPQTFTNVTLYDHSSFGISRIDCRIVAIRIGPCAQYPSAVHLTYVPKGKRTPRQTVKTYAPYLLLVPTKNAIDPDASLVTTSSDDSGTTSVSRYLSCDPRWRTDFDAALLQANMPILADYRGFNTMAL